MPLSLIGQRDYLMYCVNDFYGLVSVLGRNFVDIISLSAVSKLLAASPCLQSLRMHADISIFCLTKKYLVCNVYMARDKSNIVHKDADIPILIDKQLHLASSTSKVLKLRTISAINIYSIYSDTT